jgi:hypothetical protein
VIGVLLFVGAVCLTLWGVGCICDAMDRHERNELERVRFVYGRAAKRALEEQR